MEPGEWDLGETQCPYDSSPWTSAPRTPITVDVSVASGALSRHSGDKGGSGGSLPKKKKNLSGVTPSCVEGSSTVRGKIASLRRGQFQEIYEFDGRNLRIT